ncbi:hypothetical protein [Rubellimicrobium aerolatum]|uniref:Uncharacterized protein n=1 Tax=Rubellimicrobium aerolatum TaxID=490979 RepID=A0ABW0S8S1_9RHOB|nr:hypothetical protein [Rubellimicrobium aerolatum]MBP1804684.1 hypothetical protein [Rubellimicrobium aerolatum]
MNQLSSVIHTVTTPQRLNGVDALRRFIEDHADGLRHAAELLGGEDHARSVDELVDLLIRQPGLSRQACRRVDRLLQLLSLELVSDLNSPEAGCFALIPPDHPDVADLCLLADGLRDAVAGAGDYLWSKLRNAPPRAA